MTTNGTKIDATQTNAMSADDAAWWAEHARRSFERLQADAKQALRDRISAARAALDEAERRLDEDQMPNTCGILQSRAMEIEMALARMDVLRDAKRCIDDLARALPTESIEARVAKPA